MTNRADTSGRATPVPTRLHIITVCLNDDEGLARTCESIDSQEEGTWIHWIQDGGSESGLSLIRLRYQHKNRYIESNSDLGIYDAMNRASEHNLGPIVMYLNAGDVFAESDVVKKICDSFDSMGWRWAIGQLEVANTDFSTRLWNPEPVSAGSLRLGLGGGCPHPSTVFSRALLDQVLPYDTQLAIAADQALCLKAFRIDSPYYLRFAVSRFAAGGVSQRIGRWKHELELRRLRLNSGVPLLGNGLVDAALVPVLLAARLVRSHLKRH